MIGKIALTLLAVVAGIDAQVHYAHGGYAGPQYVQQRVAVAQPAVARVAAPLAYAAPVAKAVVASEPFDPHPQYNYAYSVADTLTGDQHSHQESRDGDVVKGQYSLVESDGSIRTVTYTADAVNGFNAVVERSAPGVHKVAAVPAVAKVAAPVAYAQPAYHAYQPQQVVAHAAPVARFAQPLAYAQPAARVVSGGYAAAPAAFGGYAHAQPVHGLRY